MGRCAVVMMLMACGPKTDQATILVEIPGRTEVAAVEVFEPGATDDTGDDRPYFIQERVPLPATFMVDAGTYVVGAAQGTCYGSEQHSVEPRETLTVSLTLECPE